MRWVWALSAKAPEHDRHMMWLPKARYNLTALDSSSFSSIWPSVFFIICLSFSSFLHFALTQTSSIIVSLSLHSLQFCPVLPFVFSRSLNLRCSVSLSLSSFCPFYFLPFELLRRSLPFFHSVSFWSNNHASQAAGIHTVDYSWYADYAMLSPLSENKVWFAVAPKSHRCRMSVKKKKSASSVSA